MNNADSASTVILNEESPPQSVILNEEHHENAVPNRWNTNHRKVILAPSFLPRGRHLSSGDIRNGTGNLILPRASKPNRNSRNL
ncbi:hypothetical protein TNCV_3349631 [Trichonephila clavipes]|nr:hypothetical protein TNCV_3349631 [Trichonephila clavipes]